MTATSRNIIHQPHDAFTKAALTYKAVALELFREYLPATIKHRVNWSTLKLWQSQLVGEHLKKSATDIVYEAELSDDGNGDQVEKCLCYIHCEQTSSQERGMPLRVSSYKHSLLLQYLSQNPTSPLPAIFCIVIYNGTMPYTYETDLLKIFSDPELAKESLLKPMTLLDLSKTPDDEVMKNYWSGGLLGTLKHVRQKTLPNFMKNELQDCFAHFEKNHGMLYAMTIVNYIYDQGVFLTKQQLRALIEANEKTKEVKKKMSSIAETLRKEGRQETCHKIALRFLKEGGLPLEKLSSLLGVPIDQLKSWAKQHDLSSSTN